jgi:hypothetical protein
MDMARRLQWARRAAEMVLNDIGLPPADPTPAVIVGEDDDLLRAWIDISPWPYPKDRDVLGWVIGTDYSAIGLPLVWAEDWDEWLVRVADIIQEAVIEDPQHWGSASPQCPSHPDGHPLNAAIREGVAIWCCPKGNFYAPIGSLA